MSKIWSKRGDMEGCKFLVVRRDGTVPSWLSFTLGSRDPAAPAALRAYADAAYDRGMDPDYIASVRELADDFEREQDQLGLGDPDSNPHRKDDPNIVAAMVKSRFGVEDGMETKIGIAYMDRRKPIKSPPKG